MKKKSLSLFVLVALSPFVILAAGKGSATSEIDRQIQVALKETQGRCQLSANPHSFACTEWTYTNSSLFPLFKMDSVQAVEGEWFAVTYVNPASENDGPEFFMGQNPKSRTQPMGVINKNDNTQMGKMIIKSNEVIFENWRGRRVASEPGSLKLRDNRTVQFNMTTSRGTDHTFHCRDFNRNSNHHLLCDWWVRAGNSDWAMKGYIGFLPMDVWNNFLQHGKR